MKIVVSQLIFSKNLRSKFLLSVISAAHCVNQANKEDILILANSLANEIGKNKRFGETTHHVDEIRLHEDYVRD